MMRSLKTLLLGSILAPAMGSAQVLNDAGTLGRGDISLGVSPVFYSGGGNSDFRLFFDAGFGLSSSTDLAFRAGLGEDPSYFGADVEFSLLRSKASMSATLGAHKFAEVGIDGTLNLSFPVTSNVGMFLGMDADVEFGSNDTRLPAWFFFGTGVFLQRSLELLFEGNVAVSNDAASIFAVGIKVYL